MNKPANKEELISFKIPSKLKREIERRASDDKRTLSNYMRLVISNILNTPRNS